MPVLDGERISRDMAEAGLSHAQLAEIAGVSVSTVKRAITSKNLSPSTLARITDALFKELPDDERKWEITQSYRRNSIKMSEKISRKLATLAFLQDQNQDDIIRRAAVTQQDVTEMMAGKPIEKEVAEEIAKFLGTNLEQVIRGQLSGEQARRMREARSQMPPEVPAQTRSAHFAIRDGLVTTVPTQEIGPDENDYRRLAALQAPLLHASKKSQAELSKHNKPFAALLDLTDKYLRELNKNVREINYAILYAYGLQLAVTYESTEDLIEKGELPDFDLDTLTSTKSVLQLHGPFILSSKDGRDLVTDAERYERKPTEERQFQADVKQFGEILRERDDLVEEKAGDFISDITTLDDGSEQFERRYLFTKGAAKNLVIVFSAGALVASTAFIPVIGPVVAASLGLLTVEAMKKSKPFNDLSAPIKKGMDDLSEVGLGRLKQIPREQLEKMREFVLRNQDILRRVGGSSREMQWFRDVLDWVQYSEAEEQKVPLTEVIYIKEPIGSAANLNVQYMYETTENSIERAPTASNYILSGLDKVLSKALLREKLVFEMVVERHRRPSNSRSQLVAFEFDPNWRELNIKLEKALQHTGIMSKSALIHECLAYNLIHTGRIPPLGSPE